MLPLIFSTIYLLICSLNGVDASPVNTTITSLPTSNVSFSILVGAVNAADSAQRCGDIDKCRTLADIVTSCLMTILACAWFAVHRNIPAPKSIRSRHSNSVFRTAVDQKDSLIVFIVALLMPELILAWALRQAILSFRLSRKLEGARLKATEARKAGKMVPGSEADAGKIVGSVEGPSSFDRSTPVRMVSNLIQLLKNHYNSPSSAVYPTCEGCEGLGSRCYLVATVSNSVASTDECWTWSHGFFVSMGGFHGYNKDGPQHPLSPADVLELVTRGHLVPPTAEEISDKSKGDWLSKGVAIAQTVWFVMQCIARRTRGLPVTRLEVMTLAYTVITVAMYITWWHKPLNVSCAVRVPEEVPLVKPEKDAEEKDTEEKDAEEKDAEEKDTKKKDTKKKCSTWEWISNYITGFQDDDVDLRHCEQVPLFWAGKADECDVNSANDIATLVAMAFAAVHCIAWYSEFQSHLAQQLWRSSAIAIFAVPPSLIVGGYTTREIGRAFESPKIASILKGVLYTTMGIIYAASRLILIILSFTSLRGLPFGAYESVQWATFIPHI